MVDPIYEDLPEDDELTFLKLEAVYRSLCDQNVFETLRNQKKTVSSRLKNFFST